MGLNDSRESKNTVQDIIANQETVIDGCFHRFPNATVHIGSVAPVGQKQEILNRQLENLATRKQLPFIGIKGMYDRETGSLRNNMLSGIHYTDVGTRILAKELKRSLYRNRLTRHNFCGTVPNIARKESGTSSVENIHKPTQSNALDMSQLIQALSMGFQHACSQLNTN
jgi:hypothetical protein